MQSTILFVTHSIDEALLLGDRILIFANLRNDAHRQSILCDFPVVLPARTKETRYSDTFRDYKKEIENLFDKDFT